VLDDGGWHLDPYVDLGESFYSLASRYRVTLDTGANLVVATTGQLLGERRAGGRVRRSYAATDVREFAIAAGPFHRVTGASGDTDVVVWFNPAFTSAETARRVLRSARTSMTAFSSAFGAYPYPEVDVVTSAFTTFGGMEYPQIVFSNPDRLTVAHELAHQWWWGIVGNDEYAEPWLDESVATWSQYLPFSPWRSCGGYDWPSPAARISNGMDYWRAHPDEYGTVYAGGGCMLATLAHEMGTGALTDALAAHVQAHRFDVTDGEAFRATIGEAAATAAPGLDMDAFWAAWRAD
jgi:aminopeptidase N